MEGTTLKFWTWIQLAFAPKKPAIDYVLEGEIANKLALLSIAASDAEYARQTWKRIIRRKKKGDSALAQVALSEFQRLRGNCIRLEIQLAELEKRRG